MVTPGARRGLVYGWAVKISRTCTFSKFALLAIFACACEEADLGPPDAVLPGNYRQTYVEVRNCRASVGHDLLYVVVRADEKAAAAFKKGPYPFPASSVIVAEHYQDPQCSSLVGFNLMKKEAGYDGANDDWRWARLDPERHPLESGKIDRCARCHAACRSRDFVCADE
jgi:hypothetical protein